MKISMRSPISGELNVVDLAITEEQYFEFTSPNRRKVQDIFPNLTAGEREFLLTGITSEEWDNLFGDSKDIDEEVD